MSAPDVRSPDGRIGGAARRATVAAFAGSFIEWYDFYLYGTAAGLLFPTLFFAGSDPAVALVESFGGFAAGFVMRPVGAVVFGHFGDRYGRRRMLVISVLVMGIGTVLIGVLPTYSAIGVAAPVLLLTLRVLQGVGIGGEFGGGALVVLENAPRARRGLMGSFHQMGTPAGLLVSTGVLALVQALPHDALFTWGWRIPFLLGGIFVAIAYVLRRRLPETEVFAEGRKPAGRIPFLSLLRRQPKHLLLATGARLADATTFNVINVFGIAYATTTLGLPPQLMLVGFTIAAGVEIVLVPIIGSLSDRIGRRPLYLTGIVICGLGVLAYFPLVATAEPLLVWTVIVVLVAVGTGCMFSIQGTLFGELFSTRVRYTALGTVYQGSALIGGAPAPLIATGLAALVGSYWGPAGFVTAVCAISFVCILLVTETFRVDLVDDDSDSVGTSRSSARRPATAREDAA